MLTYKFSLFTRNILIGEKINGRTRYSQVRQLQKVFFPTLPWKMKYPLETWNNQHPLQNGIKPHCCLKMDNLAVFLPQSTYD